MDTRKPLAFDTETHRFGPGDMAPRIVCASVDVGQGPSLLDPADAERWLAQALTLCIEGSAVLVGHNMAFDMACALARWPDIGPLIWRAYDALGIHCTRVRERLLDMERGSRFEEDEEDLEEGEKPTRKQYSLDAIAFSRCDIRLDKDGPWRMNYGPLDGTPVEKWETGARNYAMDDARATLAVWKDQERAVQNTGYKRDLKIWRDEVGRQSAFAFSLQLMKVWGVRVDQTRVKALRERLQPKLEEAQAIMRGAGLMRPKPKPNGKYPRNMEAIRTLIAQTYKGDGALPLSKKTKQIKTAKAVLELCDHPALAAAVEHAHAEKLISAFVDVLETAGDLPIHANTDVLGADTGRMSCSKPNLHQQPREPGVRECFVARPGYVFVTCDFDGQEVRGMAEVRTIKLGKSVLADRYREDPDFDPHSYFAAQVLGMSYERAMELKANKDKKFKDDRQIFKSANLGFQYGMGAPKFMGYARGYGVNITFAASKELYTQYRTVWPDARDLFALQSSLSERGEITVEVPYVGRLRGGCGYTQIGNTWVQGFCSDITKSALWEVTKRCYGAPGTEGSALLGCRPVNVPHDEILIEAPEAYAHEAAVELEEVMVTAQQELTPHVPARATPALMRHWTKSADAAFDVDGRYVCWEDRKKEAA